ncbi:MAG: hypothetical protein IM638_20000 [Bacteroidetes bacterium]|nr:hypothetical protein [Bacteroidota bacterium]
MKKIPAGLYIYSALVLIVLGTFVYAQRNGILYYNSSDNEKFDPKGNPYGSGNRGNTYYRHHK